MQEPQSNFVEQLRSLMVVMELFRDGHYHCAKDLRAHLLEHGYPMHLRSAQRMLKVLHQAGLVQIHSRQHEGHPHLSYCWHPESPLRLK